MGALVLRGGSQGRFLRVFDEKNGNNIKFFYKKFVLPLDIFSVMLYNISTGGGKWLKMV